MAGCTADGASGAVSHGVTSPAPTSVAARPEVHSSRRARLAGCPWEAEVDELVSRPDGVPVDAGSMSRK
jgi:hypothetical protein